MLRVSISTIVLLIVLSATPCLAQELQSNKSSNEPTHTPEIVAILPWVYENGTTGSRAAVKEYLETSLKKSLYFRDDSFSIIPEKQVVFAWTHDLGQDIETQKTSLPSPKELLKLGQKLRADWVISGHAIWHTRSVWIGLGPKTKSDCIVDMVIVDVKKRELSLDARKVKMDSAPRENPIKAATTILLGVAGAKGLFSSALPFTLVSGGPKTPPEMSAGQSAVAKAIRPWLAIHPNNRTIDTSDETESE